MKLDRRDFLIASSSAFLLTNGVRTGNAATSDVPQTTGVKVKTAAVYTTAKDTGERISAAGNVAFTSMAQPLESQTCVFIDPRRTFQSFLGIGGAITDASAETLCKAPKRQASGGPESILRPA